MMILGFDVGTTSIGWAAIKTQDELSGAVVAMGVRIFPEARNPEGLPLNQQRRAARMMRRQTRRRQARRRAFNEALSTCGLLPPFGSADWSQVMGMEPYALRRAALERDLSPHELGRVLYHLSKRRHFKARDLEEADAQDETQEKGDGLAEKQEKSARETFVAALRASGVTLGAHLAALPAGARKRGHHAERRWVEAEFDAIVQRQKGAHSALTDDLAAHLRNLVFHQRPVFWRKSTLGECRLTPGAALAAKGSWLSQQRRMLEKVNNLAWAGGNARPLDAEERAAILTALQSQATMTWGGARKALARLYSERGEPVPKQAFNLEASEKKLLGNPLEAKLAAIFGSDWAKHPHRQEIRDACERLRQADYGEMGQRIVILSEATRRARRAQAADEIADALGLDEEEAAQLRKLSFPTGWDAYSVDALNRLMPELEKGVRLGALLNGPEYEAWRTEAFPHRAQPTGSWVERLPSAADKEEERRLKGVRNPTVVRVLNELRKVTNNLIAVHGKPDLIRIELARDVGLSTHERDEMDKRNKQRERERAAAKKDLEAKGIAEPSRVDVEKWLLWKECGEVDPYSGARIGFDDLFRTNAFDVEHIWPRALCNDDSFANKTLCRKDFNLLKGKRLPFDAFGADADLWAAMKERVAGMEARKGAFGMNRGKIRRFVATEIPADFASRQLNDTGYAARQAVESLKRLWPDEGPSALVRVQAVTGRVTAHLRKLWGLNNILSDDGEKTRADHRHHAIDALTVACAHPGMTQKLSRYWQEKDAGAARPVLTPPWPDIRAQAQAAMDAIVVSHRVRKKVSGPLHDQTVYGDTQEERTVGKTVYRRFTARKPLEALSKGRIEDIRDEAVRAIVQDWVTARGGDPKKAFPPYPRLSNGGPEIRKARIWVDQQLSLMARLNPKAYADPGANHHMAIFETADGAADYEVVSLYEAARRLGAHEPLVRRTREGGRFRMALSPGDVLSFPRGEAEGYWVVTGVWASGPIILERLNDAAHATVWRPGPARVLKEAARKVSVDPIGRIRAAGD
jgi:CRISPR-associated endonuclease Csn1